VEEIGSFGEAGGSGAEEMLRLLRMPARRDELKLPLYKAFTVTMTTAWRRRRRQWYGHTNNFIQSTGTA
jgi:hypothetical protein